MGLIILTLIYNIYQKEAYYNSDLLALFTENYLFVANITISDSVFNDTYLCINIMIGLSMILIGLFPSRKTMSIKDKFLFIVENKYKLFIIGLTMLLAISALNMLLFIVGLGITVDTSSVTLFVYTFFPKLMNIRIILIFITCSITKELRLDNVSLSLSTLMVMMVLGSVNYFYVLPYFKLIMLLGLTKLDNLLTRIYLVYHSASLTNSTQSLAEGIYNIITKFPIIGRFFNSFRSYDYHYYRSSPFRSSYNEVIKNKVNFYPLTKISKFTKIDLFRNVEKRIELFYLYKGNLNSLEAQLKNDSLYLRDLISHFVSSYSNLTCKINLTCADQIVNINTTFKNGDMEEFNLKTTNLNFVNKVDKNTSSNLNFLNSLFNPQCSKDLLDLSPKKTNSFDLCPKNINSFYDPSADRTRELLQLTDPMNNSNDLQVFMQKGSRNYDYSIQQGESSRHPLHHSNSNRGTKRSLEDVYNDQNTNISTKYPCLDIRMIELQNKNYLFLDFDPKKLDSERDSYLDEICTMGRSVLLEHYSKYNGNKSAVRTIVDSIGFSDISISENINGGYNKLFQAFYEKNLNIIQSHSVQFKDIHPFSKLYLEGNLDYPESDSSEDDSSDDGDNLDNSNLDGGDHSNNYVSLGDSTQKGKEVLKSFTSEEIHDLINRLRSKQLAFLSKIREDNSVRCSLKDIGLTLFKGTFLFKQGENAEDEITNMFNVLIKVKPDLFSNLTHEKDIIKVGVNSLCSRLKKLTQNSVNDLTEENLTILTKELKSRIHNFFRDRGFDVRIVTCEFRDIQIKNLKGIIVEGSNLVENDFTKLLTILMEKKPEFFTKRATEVNLPKTGLIALYNRISNFIRKPITKDQITFLINGLESRKNNLLEHRKSTGNTSEFCVLSDFFFTKNSILLEKDAVLAEYELTGLLENLRKEKPHLFIHKGDIDLLITHLRSLYKRLI